MHMFYSTRPTQPYHHAYDEHGKSADTSATRMRVLTIERRKKSLLVSYLLQHPYRSYLVGLALAVALSANAAWGADMLEAHQQGDVSYISGGIGSDETDALALVKQDYNLHLTSTDATGHYLSGERIIIRNAADAIVVDVVAQGPLFFASLPHGRYRIESMNGSESKTFKATIKKGVTLRKQFVWATTPEDAQSY
jgi:hypothetical protein